MNIDTLKTELTTDPLGRGYSGMSDTAAANDLNGKYRTRDKATMTSTEVYNAIDETDWSGLTADEKAEVWNILHLGTLNPFGLESDRFNAIFGGGSTTITALVAARKESISRGEELGLDTLKPGHVEEARRA